MEEYIMLYGMIVIAVLLADGLEAIERRWEHRTFKRLFGPNE